MTRRALVLLLSMAAAPAWGYRLSHSDTCNPGAAWTTGSTVKVRLLEDSFNAYADDQGLSSAERAVDYDLMLAESYLLDRAQ